MSHYPEQHRYWRIVAGFIFLGLTANLIFIVLVTTGILTTVTNRTMALTRLIPPAADRLWPTLQILGRLRQIDGAYVAFAYMALITILSFALALGLWKAKKLAAWIVTILMLYTLASESLGIVRLMHVLTFGELVTYGRLPALLWSAVYLLLLWVDSVAVKFRRVEKVVET